MVRYDDVGDSAAWTGLHLAALAHEYNVTKNSTVLVCTHKLCMCTHMLMLDIIQKDIEKSLDAVFLLTMCSGKPGYIVSHILVM